MYGTLVHKILKQNNKLFIFFLKKKTTKKNSKLILTNYLGVCLTYLFCENTLSIISTHYLG